MSADSISINKENVKVVDNEVISILQTVLEQCEKEKSKNGLNVSLEAAESRASNYTGYSTHVFMELHNRKKALPALLNLKIIQKILLLKTFKDIYFVCENTEKLSYSKILTWIFNHTGIFQLEDHFYITRQLCAMGYEYKNTTVGPLIVESAQLRFERFQYLSKITRMRNNDRPICYIDVRVVDTTLNFEKYSSSMPDDGNKFYCLHAISNKGYINGMFCNVMKSEIFFKWITDILVTILAPNSVLVIDSSEFFNEKIKPVSRYSSKKDMLQWLKTNDIPCSSEMYKPELYELITKSGIKCSDYKIDNVLKAYGHDVLRKPKNFEDLTPTELFWSHLKQSAYNPDITSLVELKEIPLVELKQNLEINIDKIEQLKWELFSEVVANWEKDIFEIDCEIENILDSFKFKTENINEAPSIPFPYFFSKLKD